MKLRYLLASCGATVLLSGHLFAAVAPVENVSAGVVQGQVPPANAAPGSTVSQMSPAAAINNAPPLSVAQQINKLNNQINLLTPLKQQVEFLQQRVDRLQGEIDEKDYKISQLQKRMQSMLNGFDSRLLVLEGSATKAEAVAAAHKAARADGTIGVSHGNSGQAAPTAQERKAYQAAYQLLSERKYTDAATAFEGFLKHHPKSDYAVSAYFWLGEIYIIEGMPDKAMVSLRKIIQEYPHSDKAPSAAYHLGTIYVANGDAEHAKEMFLKVVSDFPKSKSARLAKEQLKQLNS